MRIKRLSLLILLVTILIIFFASVVNAEGDVLKSLDIDVYINNDGSARIKERRVINFIEGTENYIVIGNLGKSEIKDFKVTENEREYEFIKSWNLDASREEKAFKNGIIKKRDEYELCWGIGEYGEHEYIIEYTVTNFIKELEDSQILFWRFVNGKMNIPPQRVSVSITSFDRFTKEKQKVWGFGFEGNVNFEQGRVFAQSKRPLNQDNYVTILLKLDKGMFATSEHLKKSFEEVKEQAFVGSDYGSEKNSSDSSLFGFLLAPIVIMLGFVGAIIASLRNKTGVFRNKFKGEYYRDFPYEGNIMDIYHMLYKMGLGSFNNMLTGFLLKWINEDRILTFSEEVGTMIKRQKTTIKILNREQPKELLERELFNFLLKASGGQQILEEKAFIKWTRKNYDYINEWEGKAKLLSIAKLKYLGYYEKADKKVLFISWQGYEVTYKGTELQGNIYKYMNYLSDYSLINEHEAVNVKLWDNIMVWAGFLGITAAVSKQFEKLYPRYSEDSVYRGNSIYLATSLTNNVSSARSSANAGSGGSTSSGGGGGSSGGGSGGGSR